MPLSPYIVACDLKVRNWNLLARVAVSSSNRNLSVARCSVECFTVAINPKLFIFDPAFGARFTPLQNVSAKRFSMPLVLAALSHLADPEYDLRMC